MKKVICLMGMICLLAFSANAQKKNIPPPPPPPSVVQPPPPPPPLPEVIKHDLGCAEYSVAPPPPPPPAPPAPKIKRPRKG